MKPPPFRYVRAESAGHALEELSEAGYEGKIIAGGQSLVPMLNLRLARPSVLVDIGRIGLDEVSVDGPTLTIGSTVRQSRLIEDQAIRERLPILAYAAHHIGHPAIRNRGTVGGSICHADPTAELPLMAMLLDAELEIRTREGSRLVPSEEFFLGTFTTAVEPDELLGSIRVPLPPSDRRFGFVEVAERTGDFALAAAGVALTNEDGNFQSPRVVVAGGGDRPVRSPSAEAILEGAPLTDETISAAANAARSDVDPQDDVHASAAYRCHLVGVVVERALRHLMRGGETWKSN